MEHFLKKGHSARLKSHIYLLASEIDCGEPCDVQHSQIDECHTTGTLLGDMIAYVCDAEYQHVAGNLNRTCLETGEWSGEPPVCRSK